MLTKKILLLMLLFLTGVLEITVLGMFSPGSFAPSAVLIFLIILSTGRKFENLWPWALIGGLLADLLAFSPVGVSAISFLLIIYGGGFLAKRFFVLDKKGSIFAIFLFAAGGTLIHHLLTSGVYLSLDAIYGRAITYHSLMPSVFAIKLIGCAIIFPVMYWPISKIRQLIFSQENKYAIK